MRKCQYCGNFIDYKTQVCPHCGAVQEETNFQVNPQNAQVNNANQNIPTEKKESTLGIIAFVIALLLSAIAGFIMAIIDISTNKKDKHGFSKATIIISIIKIIITIILIFGVFLNAFNKTKSSFDDVDSTDKSIISEFIKEIDKDISIELPQTPITVNTYDFEGNIEIASQITDIKLKKNYSSVEVDLTINMIENRSIIERDYSMAVYKVLDSSGTIVDTGMLMVGPMSAGDKMQDTITLFGLKKGEKYSLVFEDYK